MTVIFFKKEINYAINAVKRAGHCAFWFTKGLSSYAYIDTFINVESFEIEKSIFEDFSQEYPGLIKKYTCNVFDSHVKVKEVNKSNRKICFFASNDTIVKSFEPILRFFGKSEYDLFCRANENARSAAEKVNLTALDVDFSIPNIEQYGLLVLGNDWGPLERKINADFLFKKINTVCIQESSIDFNPLDGRMRNCSLPIFQGVATLENIDISKKISAVIGNPRFEQLETTPMQQYKQALVNVNFTYGIFENARNMWVSDVADACKSVGLDFVISQHPRDKGVFQNLAVIKSNPLLVHDSIKSSSVIISRFSALLTEAVCLGRPAIYYNPHGEHMHYKFTDEGSIFFYVTKRDCLSDVLRKAVNQVNYNEASRVVFLRKHLGNTIEKKASEFISTLLKDVLNYDSVKKMNFYQRIKVLRFFYKFEPRVTKHTQK